MKTILTILLIQLLFSFSFYTQGVGINLTGAGPNNNAILDVSSDDKGVLITRLTTVARTTLGTALGLPDNGMLVYDKDLLVFYFWDGTQWVLVGNGAGSDDQNLTGVTLTGTSLQIDIENGTSTTADLSSLVDHDWYEQGTTSAPDNINDNLFTQGNVGIGINTPNSKLDVNGDILYSGNASSQFQITSTSDNILLNMIKTSSSSVNAQILLDGYGAPIDQGQIRFFTRWDPSSGGPGTLDHAMSIMETGNVGIGTTTPTEKLEINGSIKITDGTQGVGKVLISDANGVGSWGNTANSALTTADVSSGTFPQANGTVIVPANGLYDLGSMTVSPGVYMWFIYNCAGQVSYTSGTGNAISIIGGSATVTSTSTWANLQSNPSGSCGTIYTGVVKVHTAGTVSARFSSYLGSVLTKNSATALGVTLVKIN